jgi:Flp pilus assembly protein TadD
MGALAKTGPGTCRQNVVMATMAAFIALAACQEPPNPEQRAAEDKQSRAAQVMRVADVTARGGDLAAAASLYRRAHEIDPESPEPLIGLGWAASRGGEYGQAAEAFRLALALDETDLEARLGYGNALIALDRPELAATEFQKAIETNKNDHRAYNGLGVARDLSGDHGGAQQIYGEGLKVNAQNLALRNNLGLSMALAGDFNGAIRQLLGVISDPHATSRNRLNLALVYGLSGNLTRAAEVARQDLDGAQVRNNLLYYQKLKSMPDKVRAAEVLKGPAVEPKD